MALRTATHHQASRAALGRDRSAFLAHTHRCHGIMGRPVPTTVSRCVRTASSKKGRSGEPDKQMNRPVHIARADGGNCSRAIDRLRSPDLSPPPRSIARATRFATDGTVAPRC